MRPPLIVALLTAVVLALLPSSPASAASASVDYANQAHRLTNDARERHDLDRLQQSACLKKRAKVHAAWMASHQKLEHQDLGKVQQKCGVGYAGENIAYGYRTGKDVVKGWMHSDGHRANILSDNYTLMGIGAVKRRGTWWVAQVFGKPA